MDERLLRDIVNELGTLRAKLARLERATKAGGAGGASALSDLTDVVLGTLALGDVLKYDGTQWVDAVLDAAHVSYAGGTGMSATDVEGGLDELANEKADAAAVVTSLALKADLASPALTGNPTAPTATPGDNDTSIATTAFVTAADALLAPKASPTFIGTVDASGATDVKVPTAAVADDDTTAASTAWVNRALGNPSTAKPSCRAYRTTNQSIADATDVAITFDAERYDTDGMHDLVTNTSRITINTPGVYTIDGMIEFAASGTGIRRVWIRLNGSTVIAEAIELSPSGSNVARLTLGTQYNLAATDYLELVVRQNSTAALNVNNTNNSSPELAVSYIGASTAAWGNAATGAVALASTQSIPNTTTTSVAFGSTDVFDTDVMHDTATNNSRITIKTAGTYIFQGTSFLAISGTGQLRLLGFRKNGGALLTNGQTKGPVSASDVARLTSVLIDQAVVGDYYELALYHDAGAALTISSLDTNFSAVRVGYQTNPVDIAGTYMASMYLANSGAPTHTSNGGWQKVADGGGTDTWTSEWDKRPSGVAAQVDTATNKRIDIKKTGLYHVTASIAASNSVDAATWAVGVYVNGSARLKSIITTGAIGNPTPKVSEPLSLTAGDYVELYAFQTESASEAYLVSESHFNRLTVSYLGAAT